MSKHYGDIAFTDQVRQVQNRYGSGSCYGRRLARGAETRDAMPPEVLRFLAERDGFYVSTVSETGWPYVQYRGGPRGFLRALDERTLGWADFRGNLQYISTGNLAGDDRLAILAMDYPHRRRLKIFGRARVVFAENDPHLVAELSLPDYDAHVERAVVVEVEAHDWNCPQHITPRYTAAEFEPRIIALTRRMAALEAENQELRRLLAADD